jgi:hypothetical protein
MVVLWCTSRTLLGTDLRMAWTQRTQHGRTWGMVHTPVWVCGAYSAQCRADASAADRHREQTHLL